MEASMKASIGACGMLLSMLWNAPAESDVIYRSGFPQLHAGGGSIADGHYSADDFTTFADAKLMGVNFWTLEFKFAPWDGTVQWSVLADSSGMPGTILYSGSGVNTSKRATGRTFPEITVDPDTLEYYYEFDIGNNMVDLDGSKTYWLQLSVGGSFIGWSRTDGFQGFAAGTSPAYQGTNGAFTRIPGAPQLAFELEGDFLTGDHDAVSEPATLAVLGFGFAVLWRRKRVAQVQLQKLS